MPQAYPPIEPYKTHRLRVSELHEIHVEESGNPQGIPAVFVHGGPGGGTEAWYRQFCNPQKYRIVLFDQRGCGKSTPPAELREKIGTASCWVRVCQSVWFLVVAGFLQRKTIL